MRRLHARAGSSLKREELRYWRSWIESRGGEWPEAFEQAINPAAPLTEPLIEDRIGALSADPVEILDVGAGPMTVLGKVHPAKRLRITAVDPLAAEYAKLMRRAGLTPPVPTIACAGEDLVAELGMERFDVVYARNSIDHSVDAPRVIEQMLAVLRPGGFAAMRHYRNEAELRQYEGMHRWNFDIQEGALVVWNKERRVNLKDQLAGRAAVECRLQPTNYHAPFLLCVMTKS